MKTLEILKNKKEELIDLTLALMETAINGDRANRTFYFVENEDGSLSVDYLYYNGQQQLGDNCFYTILDYETPDPESFGCDTIEEMAGVGFGEFGFDDIISNAIDNQISLIEI